MEGLLARGLGKKTPAFSTAHESTDQIRLRNRELGEYISRKIASAEWGDGVVEELAADLARRYLGVRGYTRPNLFRMRQFYKAYRSNRKVSPLVKRLPWTHHLIILSQVKPLETREYYILAAIRSAGPSESSSGRSARAPSCARRWPRRKSHQR